MTQVQGGQPPPPCHVLGLQTRDPDEKIRFLGSEVGNFERQIELAGYSGPLSLVRTVFGAEPRKNPEMDP